MGSSWAGQDYIDFQAHFYLRTTMLGLQVNSERQDCESHEWAFNNVIFYRSSKHKHTGNALKYVYFLNWNYEHLWTKTILIHPGCRTWLGTLTRSVICYRRLGLWFYVFYVAFVWRQMRGNVHRTPPIKIGMRTPISTITLYNQKISVPSLDSVEFQLNSYQ